MHPLYLNLLACLWLSLPGISLAQMPAGMDQEKMRQMMQGMQAMQSCMANVDQNEMQRFQLKAQAMHSEVKALCESGKRDEAMSTAIAFGKESAGNSALQHMQKCGQSMQGMMPPIVAHTQQANHGNHPRHICDALSQ